MVNVNIVDSVLAVLLCLFALRGYFKGLFRESFSLLGLFLGFVIALRYDEPVAAFWKAHWRFSPVALKVVTFVALFFVVYFVSNLIGWLLHRSSKFLFLQTINRLGGIAVGVGKGTVVLALILLFVSSVSWLPQSWRKRMDGSYLVSPLRQIGARLVQITKADLLKSDEFKGRHREGLGVI